MPKTIPISNLNIGNLSVSSKPTVIIKSTNSNFINTPKSNQIFQISQFQKQNSIGIYLKFSDNNNNNNYTSLNSLFNLETNNIVGMVHSGGIITSQLNNSPIISDKNNLSTILSMERGEQLSDANINHVNLNVEPTKDEEISKVSQVDGLNDDSMNQEQDKGDSLNQKLLLEMMSYKKNQNDSSGWYDVTITKSLKHLVTDYIIKNTTPEVKIRMFQNVFKLVQIFINFVYRKFLQMMFHKKM